MIKEEKRKESLTNAVATLGFLLGNEKYKIRTTKRRRKKKSKTKKKQ